jgi:hypothetical protein
MGLASHRRRDEDCVEDVSTRRGVWRRSKVVKAASDAAIREKTAAGYSDMAALGILRLCRWRGVRS